MEVSIVADWTLCCPRGNLHVWFVEAEDVYEALSITPVCAFLHVACPVVCWPLSWRLGKKI
jgi:hypothetical protein